MCLPARNILLIRVVECSGTSSNNASQAPTFGLSKPSNVFGLSTNATSAPQSSGLFGTSNTNQSGGLFGATQTGSQPQQQGAGLFGASSNQQGGGLFGSSTQQSLPQHVGGGLFGSSGQGQTQGQINQQQQQQQQQTGGSLFPSLNQSMFG